jgi:hypothetical protein
MNPNPIILILASKERAELNSKDTNNFFMYVKYSIVKIRIIGFGFMVVNATFNNISVISWRSGLLVVETGENHRSVASH